MDAKKYRLETVLEVRNRAKDEAARAVSMRMQKLELEESELFRRRTDLESCLERLEKAQTVMSEGFAKGIQAKDALAHQLFLDDLRKNEITLRAAMSEQTEAVSLAARELEAARSNLIEATREVKAIETHKMNWETTQKSETDRKVQKIDDEIGAILHSRNKKRS